MKVERVFELLDADHNGFLETDEFVKGISQIPGVLQITLSDGVVERDTHLRTLAKSLDRNGKISVLEFLGAFSFDDSSGVADALAEHMLAVLYRHRHAALAGARYFDPQATGKIAEDEFLHVLQALNAEMEASGMHFTQSQMEDLCEGIAVENDTKVREIAYEDFFDAFRIVDSQNAAIAFTAIENQEDAENEEDAEEAAEDGLSQRSGLSQR